MSDSVLNINIHSDQAFASGKAFTVSAITTRNTAQYQKVNGSQNTAEQSIQVTISEEARRQFGLLKESESNNPAKTSNDSNLSSEELKELSALKTHDREVRAHELAHVMVGGSLVRKGASYQYEMGPDGVRYAVSGEVSIDTSAVDGDPTATIRKMQQVKRAALAPAEPSSQDRSVAASATQTEAQARQELNTQPNEES